MTRRRAIVAAAVALLLAAAAAGWVLIAPAGNDAAADKTPSYDLATVKRRDLRVGTRLAGTWGNGDQQPIPVRAAGTVTWLPPAGKQANLGDTLLRVDNRPVILMYGITPAYRTMDAGSEPDAPPSGPGKQKPAPPQKVTPPSTGPDVEQLERGLAQLGYAGFTIDEEYTAGTAAAVRTWQEDLGVTPTGRVELGDVVFLPGPIRLHPAPQSLGQAVTDTSVQQSGTLRLVTAEAEDADWAEAGARVDVTLPNQKTVPGRVTTVDSSGNSDTEATSGTQVTIRLARDYPHVSPGPVEVTHVSARRHNVLTVPVTALIALAEGGYAVELAEGGYVAVKPGLYAEGLVEVTGDVEPGTKVRVPK